MTRMMSAKTIVYVILVMFSISACAPSESAIQTAIAQTQVAVANTQAAWTETPAPTSTATVSFLWSNCVLGKTITPQSFEQFSYILSRFRDNPNNCIYGVITKKDVIEIADSSFVIFDIFPPGKPITFLITAPYEVVFTTADVGDCVVARGYADRSDANALKFVSSHVTDIPQLTSQLGMSSPIVQEISTLCK